MACGSRAQMKHEFVKRALLFALDHGARERELVVTLLQALHPEMVRASRFVQDESAVRPVNSGGPESIETQCNAALS